MPVLKGEGEALFVEVVCVEWVDEGCGWFEGEAEVVGELVLVRFSATFGFFVADVVDSE